MAEANRSIQKFYDEFWPEHVQNFLESKKYALQAVSGRSNDCALDAGCGPGICSVAFSEIAKTVTTIDISPMSIETARKQALVLGHPDIQFSVGDLQELSAPSNKVDLVWCSSVAMMAQEPLKGMHHLFRVTRPGGELYLGHYLKTWLSPVYQLIRHFCRPLWPRPDERNGCWIDLLC